jgi:hypothetical protein
MNATRLGPLRPRPSHGAGATLASAASALCLFLFILGAKWSFIDRYGTDMPDWDQWDAEALHLYAPWFTGNHFVRELFTPHNEHRIVPTKLQNLTLTLLNGQWDSRLECVTNALLHTALAVALFVLGRRWIAAACRRDAPASAADDQSPGLVPLLLNGLWFVAVAACFSLPLGWQNTLGGFHSQQYWLLGLSCIALVGLPFARPGRAAWWLSAAAGSVALVAMGSGFLAAAVVIVVIALRVIRRCDTLRTTWPTLVLCAVLCAVGWFTRAEVPYHATLMATGVGEFLLYAAKSLQWPEPLTPLAAFVIWLPWLGVAWRAWREPAARGPMTLVGLGGWVLLQIFATAYARGAHADWPASRYMDTLLLGIVFNAVALLWHLAQPRATPAAHFATGAFTTLWILTLVHGFSWQVEWNFAHEISGVPGYYHNAGENTRRYVATNDPHFLDQPDIPYPSASGLRERIDRPEIRHILPVGVRAPLTLEAAKNSGFIEADTRRPPYPRDDAPAAVPGASAATPAFVARHLIGSFAAGGAAAVGEWRSAPLTSPLGAWLKFETAGDLGNPAARVALELHDARTDALLDTVAATKVPGDTWRAAFVRAPAQPFVVVARDADPAHWLAFGAPTEMGRLSHFAWLLAKNGALLYQCSIGASLVVGLAASLAVWRSRRVRVAA